jgi:hypothetical protein
MAANREYKNSVFSLLFGNEKAAKELYEAIEGVKLPPGTPVEINTLEGVLYMTLLNDVSFEVGGKLVVLVEHQSTVNPNMALRLLMYLARVYEKITAGRDMYGIRLVPVPRPECFVLYNGSEPYPDEETLRLSDSFMDAASVGIPAGRPPSLELAVKVYNINAGHNEAMAARCKLLRDYAAFIARAREAGAERGGKGALSDSEREAALKEAVGWCIARGILKDFLTLHGSEVANMLMTEWKLEDALAVRGRQEREEGEREGMVKKEAEILRLIRSGISMEELENKLAGRAPR